MVRRRRPFGKRANTGNALPALRRDHRAARAAVRRARVYVRPKGRWPCNSDSASREPDANVDTTLDVNPAVWGVGVAYRF
jgi:hypothetical protein